MGCVGLLKYLRAFDVPGASTALIKALRLVNCSLPTARSVIVDMFSEVYISNKVCFVMCEVPAVMRQWAAVQVFYDAGAQIQLSLPLKDISTLLQNG